LDKKQQKHEIDDVQRIKILADKVLSQEQVLFVGI